MSRRKLLTLALASEAFLLALALALGSWLQVGPGDPPRLIDLLGGLALGVLLAPLPRMVLRSQRFSRWRLVEDFRRLMPMFASLRWPGDLVLLGLLAGVGEEALFRGALQPWLARHVGEPLSIGLVALLFGGVHAVSLAYVAYASVLGVAFGVLAAWQHGPCGAMVAHAAFDALALRWAIGPRRGPLPEGDRKPRA